MALLIFILLATVLIIFGTALISNGVLLGILTVIGFIAISIRIPSFAKLAKKLPILFELGGAALTYAILGASVTGLIAAAVAGIGISALLGYADGSLDPQVTAD